MLDELIVTASVGTARKAPEMPALTPALDDALASLAGESPEGRLLGAVAILTRYETCGRLPRTAENAGEPAGEEVIAACTRRAGELLGQILAMPQGDTKVGLVDEWTGHATRAARRAPHRLLPALLDYGAARKAARRGIADVVGERGAWLMRLNPRWRFEADAGEDPAAVWTTGSRDQRVALLGRLRGTEATAARELVRSTWKEDAAEDRALFVAALARSLGEDDEVFLESCLDDRSKQVRVVAADLLARLPRSAFVGRMIERADPLLEFTEGRKGGLLRQGTAAAIAVLLPADTFDARWGRDGVIEKPEGKLGRRQWWLQQFLAALPPSHWSQRWKIDPAECIAAMTGEFAAVVIAAWHQAALRHPEPRWVAALLLAAGKEGRGPMTLDLLNRLPDNARPVIMAELLESPRFTIDNVWHLVRVVDDPLDGHCTRALLGQLEAHLEQRGAGHSYLVSSILQLAARRIPPGMYDEIAQRLTGPKWEVCRKGTDEFFQVLQVRRDLQREFTP